MSQINPYGGFFAQDAGVQVPPGEGPYGRAPGDGHNAAVIETGSDPSANTGYDNAGQHVYGDPVGEYTSAPEIVGSQGDVAQVQTDNDPPEVQGPSPAQPEVGLADVYQGIQALDAKIDGLFAQSPWVQPKPDTDD